MAALKNGVAVMKARKPSDPTSWFFQAAIHGVSTSLMNTAVGIDPAVWAVERKKFWNQCPHFGNASSADFMIWHRAYVYYFERILRAASGDDSLTIPYWDYSDPGQRGCPQVFADPDVDPNSSSPVARNPLYDARREQAWVLGLYELSDTAVSTTKAFAQNTYFASSADHAFGGYWQDLEPNSQGAIERSPHNLIHFAVGGVISTDGGVVTDNAFAGLMADPTTSAHDPLFWVHHSNIDRLWNVWGCMSGNSWGPAPPDTWLDTAPWWFYDADGTPKNLPRRFYIDSRALGIAFDDENPACTPVTSQPIPKSNLIASAEVLRATEQLAGSSNSVELSAATNVETKLHLINGSTLTNIAGAPSARRVFLELFDVTYAGPPSVGYVIFARVDPNSAWIELGDLNLFGLRHGEHMHPASQGQRFDVTTLFGISSMPVSLDVSIRPVQLLAPKRGAAPLLRSGGVKIGGLRLVTVGANPLPRQ
jgi:hypothetical protein